MDWSKKDNIMHLFYKPGRICWYRLSSKLSHYSMQEEHEEVPFIIFGPCQIICRYISLDPAVKIGEHARLNRRRLIVWPDG